jgi:hypothetical protein
MHFFLVLRLLLPVCFTAVLGAQSIAIPHSGYTFDGLSITFRPVLGVPGAAMLGEPLELRGELHSVSICSQQQFALAAAGREGVVTLFRLDSLKTTAVSPALMTAPDQIELSPGCTAAAIYSAQANRLQILTGLPGKPSISADLTLDLPASISSLAVSDDGQLAIAAVPRKAVYLLPATGRAVALTPIQRDAVVAMSGNQDAIVADQFTNTVTLIGSVAVSPVSTVLAGPPGISLPTAVWLDSRTHSIIVANSGNGQVSVLPLAGGNSEMVDCHCQLGGLSPLTDRTYQLQAPASDQPLRILDLGQASPRVVFVASTEPGSFPKGRRK